MVSSTRFPVPHWLVAVVAALSSLSPVQSKGDNEPREAVRASAETKWAPSGEEAPSESLIVKATKGDVRAQLALAYRYRDGKGAKPDHAEALRWAHLAADLGDAGARDFVGWMYFEGLGVKRSPEIAAG